MSSINNKIEKNKDFLRFIAFAASKDQAEDVLYEIQPNQLESLRSIFKLLRRKGKIQKVIDNFVSKEVTSGGNVRRTKKWEKVSAKCNIFFLKLETQAASRVMLKKNAALIVQIVQKGLNLWDVKSSYNFEKQQISLTNNDGFDEKISGKKRSKEEDEERNERKKISKNEKAAVDEKKLGKNADSFSEDNEQEERESSTGSASIAESSESEEEEEEEQQQRRQEFSAETGRKQNKTKNFFFPRERSNYSSSD